MNFLLVPVPLFDKQSTVNSFLFRYRIVKQAQEADPTLSPLLDAVGKAGGVDAFTGGAPLFVPINHQVLLGEPERQCRQMCKKIILVLESNIPESEDYLALLPYLRQLGFRFAAPTSLQPEEHANTLGYLDYLLVDDSHPQLSPKERNYFYKRISRSVKLISPELTNPADFDQAVNAGYDLFEGLFSHGSHIKEQTKITPLKANLIHLLNVVRDENFEFSTIANIVQRDFALSYSLMRFINSPFLGIRNKVRTIYHAVTILGQEEVRKWVTASVFRSLGAEQPSELIRLALVRAKFAENLAGVFGLQQASQSLFLMGLFSVLDMLLQTSMSAALDTVNVSDEIRDALVGHTGPYYKVLELIVHYKRADWDIVLNLMETHSLLAKDISQAYIEAISWYNELISDNVRPLKR